MRNTKWIVEKSSKPLLQPSDAASVGNVALPRPPEQFYTGMFGPGVPIEPYPADPPSNDGGPAEPRISEYMAGWNLASLPGYSKLVPFSLLRSASKMVLPVWRAIDVRKSELAAMEWDIALLPQFHGQGGPEIDNIRGQLIDFFSEPDPQQGMTFSDWIRLAEEEISVVDALSIYLRPTRDPKGGVLGSGLHSLQIIDGTLIKPLRDIRGGRPQPPAPAYQQYLYGAPRTDLMAPWRLDELKGSSDGENGAVRNYKARELIYKPFHRVAFSPYGFSEVESCLNEIKLWIDREKYHQAYFDQSDLPAMFLPAPPDWTPQQIDDYERRINMRLAGDPGWRHRVKVIPTGGGNPTQVRPQQYDLGFDEYLIRIIAMAFSINPENMNISPKSGLGGTGYAEESTRRQLRIAIRPRMIYIAEIINYIIHKVMGEHRFAFKWTAMSQQDLMQKAEIDNVYVAGGIRTRNEIREENGWDRSESPESNQLLVTTRQGVVSLAMANGLIPGEVIPPDVMHQQAGAEGSPAQTTDRQGQPLGQTQPVPQQRPLPNGIPAMDQMPHPPVYEGEPSKNPQTTQQTKPGAAVQNPGTTVNPDEIQEQTYNDDAPGPGVEILGGPGRSGGRSDEPIGSVGPDGMQEYEADQARRRAKAKVMVKELGHLGAHLLKHTDRPFYPVTLTDDMVEEVYQSFMARPASVTESDWIKKVVVQTSEVIGALNKVQAQP